MATFVSSSATPLGLFLGFRLLRGGRIVLNLVAEFDVDVALELFVVFVLHHHLDLLRTGLELQRVVGDGVGGEPIFAVNLLAVGLELRKLLVLAVLELADAPAVSLDDLEVLIVHPDDPFKVAL